MQQAQSQAANARADGAAGISAGAARPWAYLCELLRRRGRAEDNIAARYQGRAWCDCTEHQMSQDIMASGRSCW
jgi:hypothetical protein